MSSPTIFYNLGKITVWLWCRLIKKEKYQIQQYYISIFRLAVLEYRLGNWNINNSMWLLSAYPA